MREDGDLDEGAMEEWIIRNVCVLELTGGVREMSAENGSQVSGKSNRHSVLSIYCNWED